MHHVNVSSLVVLMGISGLDVFIVSGLVTVESRS